jgi:UDP-3-O-acyl-N-acetylglucosamine deacetylase
MSALNTQEGGNHYKDMKIQPVEFIHANEIPFIEGCIIKYVARWKNKNGIQDLKKAKHFIELLIELEEKKTIAPSEAFEDDK